MKTNKVYNSELTKSQLTCYFETKSTQPDSSLSERSQFFDDITEKESQQSTCFQGDISGQPEKTVVSAAPDIVLMPKEMQDYWPSLIEPSHEAWQEHEPTGPKYSESGLPSAAISGEEMLAVMTEMKEFMNLVLNVAFSQLHLYKQSSYAQDRYKELLSEGIGESTPFAEKLQSYFDEFIHTKYEADGSALSEQEIKTISD